MLTNNVAVIMPEEAEERLVSPAPVLITEQQIALGTAAALRPQPRRRWVAASHFLLGAFHSARMPSTHGGSTKGRGYPKHYGFLEDACLAREMSHL